MSSRIEQLQEHLKSRPRDPFLRYAIGIELKNAGRLEEALAAFEKLAEDSPDYVPTYFHYAQTLEALSRLEDALSIYERGIGKAHAAKDSHAADELSRAASLVRDLL